MSVKIKSDYAVFDRYKFYLDDVQKKVKEDCAFQFPESIQYKSEKEILSVFQALDWSFSTEDTTYLSHDIHPYPAKFPPQLPAQIIKLLSSEGEYIWDPFGGSGTTALEAALNNRNCISTDINPIGSIIGKAKTTTLGMEDIENIIRFIDRLEYYERNTDCLADFIDRYKGALEEEIPDIPNIEKWFEPTAVCELAFLKYFMKMELKTSATITIAKASFSKIITRVSNQENETTYRAVFKKIKSGDTIKLYLKDLKDNLKKIKGLSPLMAYQDIKFITTNVMESIVGKDKAIQSGTVDLVVTSPPYPNAFDYHLYHRFRIFWLDGDPRDVGKMEIGSHLKYQRNKRKFEQFEKEMTPVLKNCMEALKAGRYAIFILGNAVFDGEEYKTAEKIGKIAKMLGFINIGIIDRSLPQNKRSMKNWARRATTEQILILKKPAAESLIKLVPVEYKLWPYETEISRKERAAICSIDTNEFKSMNTMALKQLKKLTFYKGFKVNDVEFMTWQRILEHGIEDTAKRKEPKYLTHGIHPYKGKFYPQLVRPLLNILKVEAGGKVFDPFCGSGTVILESILNGYDAYGCDINPIAVEIAMVKNTIFKVNPYEFEKQVSMFRNCIDRYVELDYENMFFTDTLDEIRSWFPKKVISKMGFILAEISKVPDECIRNFLRVILSSIIREISQQEPSDLRIRRRKEAIEDAPVLELYIKNLDKQYNNIMDFHQVKSNAPESIGEAHVWKGTSANIKSVTSKIEKNSIDIVITSPPYATALPYIDTNRLNMLVLGGYTSEKRVPIEASMTGTREINKSTRLMFESLIANHDYRKICSETAKDIIYRIYTQNKDANVGFRKKNMAALIYMYFQDMSLAMETLNQVVKPGGHICIVIGDTKTTTGEEKIIIRTTQMLRESGIAMGWQLIDDIPISVTKEKYLHMYNSITENNILIFKK